MASALPAMIALTRCRTGISWANKMLLSARNSATIYLRKKLSSMQSPTSKQTRKGILLTGKPIEPDQGVGSDEWMKQRGFRPMTETESREHARFFKPCGKPHQSKIIDLV